MARKPRHLSPEEQALWDRVTSKDRPLHPPARRPAETPLREPREPAEPRGRLKPFEIGAATGGKRSTTVDLDPGTSARLSAAPLSMDRKRFRQLVRGKLRPEARIDLHGKTLAAAHPALIAFILSSHAAGRRLVLVITGKGRGGREEAGPIPVRRGALRAEVPHWLSVPPCSSVVLQVAQAHQSHGGGGAYYVYLRRPRD